MTSKRDANHDEVVRTLQAVGVEVLDLSAVGHGCPDLLVSWRGVNVLVEVKNAQGRNRMEATQAMFHNRWRGPLIIARSGMEALELLSKLTTGR